MSWLWKSDPSSPASFEKALAKLSTQLTSANLSLESNRSRARRVKALWTLYTILGYLVSAAILVLVLGPQKWHMPHYIGLIGAPVLIFGVRTILGLFFDWQIGRKQAYVEDLHKQREEKINELKKATKYDSTQELLQKYGSAPKQIPVKTQQGTKRKIASPQPQRTGIPPPPTANIVRPGGGMPNTPQRQDISGLPPTNRSPGTLQSTHTLITSLSDTHTEEPGFAPNAFPDQMPSARPSYDKPSNWYDRILDVILGDDETLAKNRLALICSKCRLVNGLASPGVQTLEEIGIWRCSNCGAGNGVEKAATKTKHQTSENPPSEDEKWQPTSRSEESSSPIQPSHPDKLEREAPVSDEEDEKNGIGNDLKATSAAREETPEIDGPHITQRAMRSSRRKYDDDDQGW